MEGGGEEGARGVLDRGTADRGVEPSDEEARAARELDEQNAMFIEMLYKDFDTKEGLLGVRGLIHYGINLHRRFKTDRPHTRYQAAEALLRLYRILFKRAADAPRDPEDGALLLTNPFSGELEAWIPTDHDLFYNAELTPPEEPPERPTALEQIPPFLPEHVVQWNDAVLEGPPEKLERPVLRKRKAPKAVRGKLKRRPIMQRGPTIELPDGSRIEIFPANPEYNRVVFEIIKTDEMTLTTKEGKAAIVAAVIRRLAPQVDLEEATRIAYAIGLEETQALKSNIETELFEKIPLTYTFTYDFGIKFLEAVEQHAMVDPRFREKLAGGVKHVKDEPEPIWRPLFRGYPLEEKIFWVDQHIEQAKKMYDPDYWRLIPGEMYDSGIFVGYGMSYDDQVWWAPDGEVYAVNQRDAMIEAFRVGVIQAAGAVILAYIMVGAATAALAPASVNSLIAITQLLEDPPKGGVGDIFKLPLGGRLKALGWALRLTSDLKDVKDIYEGVKNGEGALDLFMVLAAWTAKRRLGKGKAGLPDAPKAPAPAVPGVKKPALPKVKTPKPPKAKAPDAPVDPAKSKGIDPPSRGLGPDGSGKPTQASRGTTAAPDAGGAKPADAPKTSTPDVPGGTGRSRPRPSGSGPKYRRPAAKKGKGTRGAPKKQGGAKDLRGGKKPPSGKRATGRPAAGGGGKGNKGGNNAVKRPTQKSRGVPARPAKAPASPKSSIKAGPNGTLIGRDEATFSRDVRRLIRNTKNHPLKFLLRGRRFMRTRGKKHSELANHPDMVQMGHVGSAKGGGDRVVLQHAHSNQVDNITIEHPSKGGAQKLSAPVVDIGGVGVDRRTAKMWEQEGKLPGIKVDDLPDVDF